MTIKKTFSYSYILLFSFINPVNGWTRWLDLSKVHYYFHYVQLASYNFGYIRSLNKNNENETISKRYQGLMNIIYVRI